MASNNHFRLGSKKKIYIIMAMLVAAFIAYIAINVFFEYLNSKEEHKAHNIQNKFIILNSIQNDIYKLESNIFELPIFSRNRLNTVSLKREIRDLKKQILNKLNTLQKGGTLKIKVALNSVNKLYTIETISYRNKNDLSTASIEITPKIIKTDSMLSQIENSIKAMQNSKKNYSEADSEMQAMTNIYKMLPGFFLRIKNILNDSIYNTSMSLKKTKDNIEKIKYKYQVTQFLLMLIILILILYAIFKVLSDIVRKDKNLVLLNKKLLSSREDIKNILNAQSNIVFITNGSHLIFYNQALVELLPEVKNIENFQHKYGCVCKFFDDDVPDDSYIYDRDYDGLNWVEHLLENQDKHFRVIVNKDGVKHYLTIRAKHLHIFDRKPHIAVTLNDITDEIKTQKRLLRQKRELHYQANYDLLTSLPNRTLLLDRLKYLIKNAERNKFKFALLFLDLDNFKEINDSMGHDLGDLVLVAAAKRLSSAVRKGDIVARLGGDEFVIVLNNINDTYGVSKVASNLIKSMSKEYNIDNYTLYAEGSIGISIYPDDSTNVNDLIKYADSAMYAAKENGKRQFKYYNSAMTKDAYKKISLEADLKKAIQNREFIVYYQPQYDINNNKIVGAEALVRWIHPQRGMISPDQFIPFAETSGLISEIDTIVRDIAIDHFKEWKNKKLNPGLLSLNLSFKEIKNKYFVQSIRNLIDSKQIDPNIIGFEILERDIMSSPTKTIAKLNKIKNLGCGISLDDFGIGYSSLSYLQKLPVNKMKIDMSFIKDIPEDKQRSAIVKTIIDFGKNINVKLIAEGVENEAQKEFLLKNDCQYAQGYLYSKPLSAKEFEELLRKNKENS